MKTRFTALIVTGSLGLFLHSQAELVTGTLDISTNNTSYDGKDLVISNGTVTVHGWHAFGAVSLVETSRLVYPWTSGASNTLVFQSLAAGKTSAVDLGGGTRLTVSNQMSMDGGAVLNAQAVNNGGAVGGQWIGAGPEICAGTLVLASNALITANAQGYGSAGWYDAPGTGPGGGAAGTYSGGGGGGGHGGRGGNGARGSGGGVYGSALTPLMLGSGAGSGWNGYGFCRAGGAVKVTAGVLRLDGSITAHGANGSTDVGGGSGGSIWVQAGTLEGSGLMLANGGVGAGSCGGGGGGRIAVYYGMATGYTAFAQCVAAGGTGYATGESGSVGFFNTNVTGLRLEVLTSFNCTDQVQVAEAVIQGGQSSLWMAGASMQTLEIRSNTTVAVSNALVAGTGLLSESSQLRLNGGGVITNFSLTSTSLVTVAGARQLQGGLLFLTNGARIVMESRDNNGQVGGQWAATGSVVQVQSLIIAPGCQINADGQGYGSAGWYDSPGTGPGAGGAGSYSGGGGGGGHGGRGGNGKVGAGGTNCGLESFPISAGSGAGSGWNGYGLQRGGGAMIVQADYLRLDGTISASGQDGSSDVGGGAGGSMLLNIGVLEGNGGLLARGGAGSGTCGGGGGGRIALYTADYSRFTGFTNSSVAGGTGWQAGDVGSLFVNSAWESWVIHYWPAGGSGGPANDFDGDRMSNEQEFLTGTDPTNRNSVMQVLPNRSLTPPNGVSVQWASQPDHFYGVDRATNISPGSLFINLQSNIPGQAGTTTFIDTNATNRLPYYYRVWLDH